MTAGKSASSKPPKTVRVRFLSSVKMDRRWFAPGDEVAVSNKIARHLLERGLVARVPRPSKKKHQNKKGR